MAKAAYVFCKVGHWALVPINTGVLHYECCGEPMAVGIIQGLRASAAENDESSKRRPVETVMAPAM